MKIITFITVILLASLISGCATKSPAQKFQAQTAESLFMSAESELHKSHYKSAIERFQALEALYPLSAYAEQARLDVIYAYYKTEDTASALAAADRYIRLYPLSPRVAYVYYLRGLINFDINKGVLQKIYPTDPSQRDLSGLRQAYDDFNLLVVRYPHSPYTPDAHRRMLFIRNVFAQYELNVAEFYYKRHAYVAAANRASEVVLHYERTPQVIDALVIMVQSYRQLNEPQLADQALMVLETSYPDAPQLVHLIPIH